MDWNLFGSGAQSPQNQRSLGFHGSDKYLSTASTASTASSRALASATTAELVEWFSGVDKQGARAALEQEAQDVREALTG